MAGGRSKDAAVGGLLEQQVPQPPRNRNCKRNDADTEEYSADEEEEEENDPAWADLMAKMAEEDEDVVENDSDDENQLPSYPLTLPLASNPPPLVVVVTHILQCLGSQTLTPVSYSYMFLHHLLHTRSFVFVAFI